MLVRVAGHRQTGFGPVFGTQKMEVASDVAFEANVEGKRAEQGCYGVGDRWGLVADRRRVRFR